MNINDPGLFILGFLAGIPFGMLIVIVAGWMLSEDHTQEKQHTDCIPDFQQTLIELSKIPGLTIEGEGVHIKGPDLKGDDET